MIGRGSLWLPLAMLVLLAGLSFWIERSVQISLNNGPGTQRDPEGIMENFEALRTDEAGRPHYRLNARKLKHYSGSKRTEMESPRFVLIDARNGEINAVARQATSSPDGKEMELRGDVTVVRGAHAGRPPLSLKTAHMIVFPERNLMRAPGPVDLEDPTLNARAGAMELDATQRVIRLTGRVKARYISGKN